MINKEIERKLIKTLLSSDLRFDHLLFKEGKKLLVFDPALNGGAGGYRSGQFFVGMPFNLTKILPGSFLMPLVFFKALGFNRNLSPDIFYSQKVKKQPLFYFSDKYFSLNVFNGSTNKYALRISCLAAKEGNFKNPAGRAEYQTDVLKLICPVLELKTKFDLRIVEDCIASGDTIVGVLTVFLRKGIVSRGEKVRIDVVVATTQGILVLREFALKNKLFMEVNVSYLAYGLSRGEEILGGLVRIHANYITYPDFFLKKLPKDIRKKIESKRMKDGNMYVVGDMGDAARSMSRGFDETCPWNKFRNDSHGEHKLRISRKMYKINLKSPIVLYFANGGYLMKSIVRYLNLEGMGNEFVFSAKRVWSTDERFGYGVLISDVPFEFLK